MEPIYIVNYGFTEDGIKWQIAAHSFTTIENAMLYADDLIEESKRESKYNEKYQWQMEVTVSYPDSRMARVISSSDIPSELQRGKGRKIKSEGTEPVATWPGLKNI